MSWTFPLFFFFPCNTRVHKVIKSSFPSLASKRKARWILYWTKSKFNVLWCHILKVAWMRSCLQTALYRRAGAVYAPQGMILHPQREQVSQALAWNQVVSKASNPSALQHGTCSCLTSWIALISLNRTFFGMEDREVMAELVGAVGLSGLSRLSIWLGCFVLEAQGSVSAAEWAQSCWCSRSCLLFPSLLPSFQVEGIWENFSCDA